MTTPESDPYETLLQLRCDLGVQGEQANRPPFDGKEHPLNAMVPHVELHNLLHLESMDKLPQDKQGVQGVESQGLDVSSFAATSLYYHDHIARKDDEEFVDVVLSWQLEVFSPNPPWI